MLETPIVDMWAPILPVGKILEHAVENFPPEMLGYLRVFYKTQPTLESFRMQANAIALSEDDMLAALDAAGIGKTLITGFDEKTSVGMTWVANEPIADFAGRHPDRFIPFAGIDVLSRMAGVRAVDHWIRERGFKGVSLRPFMIGLPADDRRYYPIYAKCADLGVPVSVHSSANWSTQRRNDLGHPAHLEQVAMDFPELTIIMSHGGYPWVLEAVLAVWKHPNLYLELAGHRPKYFAEPGTGWEPLMRFGQTTIADKVLFGTGSFLLGRSPVELVREFKGLPIRPAVLGQWLHGNAARVLGLGRQP